MDGRFEGESADKYCGKDSLSDVQRVVESRYGTISGDARMRLRDLG